MNEELEKAKKGVNEAYANWVNAIIYYAEVSREYSKVLVQYSNKKINKSSNEWQEEFELWKSAKNEYRDSCRKYAESNLQWDKDKLAFRDAISHKKELNISLRVARHKFTANSPEVKTAKQSCMNAIMECNTIKVRKAESRSNYHNIRSQHGRATSKWNQDQRKYKKATIEDKLCQMERIKLGADNLTEITYLKWEKKYAEYDRMSKEIKI